MCQNARILRHFLSLLCACVALFASVSTHASRPQTGGVLVLAAASLQTALDELIPAAQKVTGSRVRISYAASSSLARQIETGAPADIFISADIDWMDYLVERRLIKPESRVNLLGNRLVLIGTKGRTASLKIAPNFPLSATLGRERLALANPDVVPAGKYAKAALTSLNVWSQVANKIAPTENVRAALLLVARGEAPLGIVYATDARVEPGVVVIDTFAESLHPPIVYPAALLNNATPAAAQLLEFLGSAQARSVFEKQGFVTKTQSASLDVTWYRAFFAPTATLTTSRQVKRG